VSPFRKIAFDSELVEIEGDLQPRDEVSFAAPEPIDAGIAIGMPDGEQKETPSGSGRAQGNRQREGRHLWHRR
jgi:hypothetical protein